MRENPLSPMHGRGCYRPYEGVCNRQFPDDSVAVHSIDRFLDDLAIESSWTVAPDEPKTALPCH
jgi:hypothetical protein